MQHQLVNLAALIDQGLIAEAQAEAEKQGIAWLEVMYFIGFSFEEAFLDMYPEQ